MRSCVDADLALSFGLVRLGPLALTLRRSVRAAGCASRAGIQLVQQSQVQKRVEHRRWQAVSALAHVLCDDAHGLKGHLAPLVVATADGALELTKTEWKGDPIPALQVGQIL